jgi:hypothetical protein
LQPVSFPIPSLINLTLSGFQTVGISSLTKLQSLDIGSTQTVLGKETIYPQLRCLSGRGDTFLEAKDLIRCGRLQQLAFDQLSAKEIRRLLPLCSNIPTLSLRSWHSNGTLSFHVGEKMKSLPLLADVIEITGLGSKRQQLQRLNLVCFDGKDISMFQNIKQLSLERCHEISDIRPIGNVPYLRILSCNNIKDYSCLGSQHYLVIEGASSLTDEDVLQLENIKWLLISLCHGIENVSQSQVALTEVLSVRNCCSLKQVTLAGEKYLKVSVTECSNLRNISVTGIVYSLHVPRRLLPFIPVEVYCYAHAY